MTSKSLELKSILKWAAGLLILGFLVVVGWIAWGMGVRWPTVHRVDQPGIPDSIYVKAVDFLDDSGYVAEVSFESCCTDRFVCKMSGAGKLFESIKVALSPQQNLVAIPLFWRQPSMCPYQLKMLVVHSKSDMDSRRTVLFDDEEPWNDFPNALHPDCLMGNHAQHSQSKCPERLSFKLPHDEDTLRLTRGGNE